MGTKLYVGNLPFSTSEEELTGLFSGVGEVASVRIVTDKFSGRSRGFAFVEMTTDEGATQAIEKLNGNNLGGRDLVVNEARPPAPREGGGGFGGGRRDGGGGGGGRRDAGGGGGGRPRREGFDRDRRSPRW